MAFKSAGWTVLHTHGTEEFLLAHAKKPDPFPGFHLKDYLNYCSNFHSPILLIDCVRNPIDRFLSEIFHQIQNNKDKQTQTLCNIIEGDETTFINWFFTQYNTRNNSFHSFSEWPGLNQIQDMQVYKKHRYQIGLNKLYIIANFDNLASLPELVNKFGFNIKLGKTNITKCKNYQKCKALIESIDPIILQQLTSCDVYYTFMSN